MEADVSVENDEENAPPPRKAVPVEASPPEKVVGDPQAKVIGDATDPSVAHDPVLVTEAAMVPQVTSTSMMEAITEGVHESFTSDAIGASNSGGLGESMMTVASSTPVGLNQSTGSNQTVVLNRTLGLTPQHRRVPSGMQDRPITRLEVPITPKDVADIQIKAAKRIDRHITEISSQGGSSVVPTPLGAAGNPGFNPPAPKGKPKESSASINRLVADFDSTSGATSDVGNPSHLSTPSAATQFQSTPMHAIINQVPQTPSFMEPMGQKVEHPSSTGPERRATFAESDRLAQEQSGSSKPRTLQRAHTSSEVGGLLERKQSYRNMNLNISTSTTPTSTTGAPVGQQSNSKSMGGTGKSMADLVQAPTTVPEIIPKVQKTGSLSLDVSAKANSSTKSTPQAQSDSAPETEASPHRTKILEEMEEKTLKLEQIQRKAAMRVYDMDATKKELDARYPSFKPMNKSIPALHPEGARESVTNYANAVVLSREISKASKPSKEEVDSGDPSKSSKKVFEESEKPPLEPVSEPVFANTAMGRDTDEEDDPGIFNSGIPDMHYPYTQTLSPEVQYHRSLKSIPEAPSNLTTLNEDFRAGLQRGGGGSPGGGSNEDVPKEDSRDRKVYPLPPHEKDVQKRIDEQKEKRAGLIEELKEEDAKRREKITALQNENPFRAFEADGETILKLKNSNDPNWLKFCKDRAFKPPEQGRAGSPSMRTTRAYTPASNKILLMSPNRAQSGSPERAAVDAIQKYAPCTPSVVDATDTRSRSPAARHIINDRYNTFSDPDKQSTARSRKQQSPATVSIRDLNRQLDKSIQDVYDSSRVRVPGASVSKVTGELPDRKAAAFIRKKIQQALIMELPSEEEMHSRNGDAVRASSDSAKPDSHRSCSRDKSYPFGEVGSAYATGQSAIGTAGKTSKWNIVADEVSRRLNEKIPKRAPTETSVLDLRNYVHDLNSPTLKLGEHKEDKAHMERKATIANLEERVKHHSVSPKRLLRKDEEKSDHELFESKKQDTQKRMNKIRKQASMYPDKVEFVEGAEEVPTMEKNLFDDLIDNPKYELHVHPGPPGLPKDEADEDSAGRHASPGRNSGLTGGIGRKGRDASNSMQLGKSSNSMQIGSAGSSMEMQVIRSGVGSTSPSRNQSKAIINEATAAVVQEMINSGDADLALLREQSQALSNEINNAASNAANASTNLAGQRQSMQNATRSLATNLASLGISQPNRASLTEEEFAGIVGASNITRPNQALKNDLPDLEIEDESGKQIVEQTAKKRLRETEPSKQTVLRQTTIGSAHDGINLEEVIGEEIEEQCVVDDSKQAGEDVMYSPGTKQGRAEFSDSPSTPNLRYLRSSLDPPRTRKVYPDFLSERKGQRRTKLSPPSRERTPSPGPFAKRVVLPSLYSADDKTREELKSAVDRQERVAEKPRVKDLRVLQKMKDEGEDLSISISESASQAFPPGCQYRNQGTRQSALPRRAKKSLFDKLYFDAIKRRKSQVQILEKKAQEEKRVWTGTKFEQVEQPFYTDSIPMDRPHYRPPATRWNVGAKYLKDSDDLDDNVELEVDEKTFNETEEGIFFRKKKTGKSPNKKIPGATPEKLKLKLQSLGSSPEKGTGSPQKRPGSSYTDLVPPAAPQFEDIDKEEYIRRKLEKAEPKRAGSFTLVGGSQLPSDFELQREYDQQREEAIKAQKELERRRLKAQQGSRAGTAAGQTRHQNDEARFQNSPYGKMPMPHRYLDRAVSAGGLQNRKGMVDCWHVRHDFDLYLNSKDPSPKMKRRYQEFVQWDVSRLGLNSAKDRRSSTPKREQALIDRLCSRRSEEKPRLREDARYKGEYEEWEAKYELEKLREERKREEQMREISATPKHRVKLPGMVPSGRARPPGSATPPGSAVKSTRSMSQMHSRAPSRQAGDLERMSNAPSQLGSASHTSSKVVTEADASATEIETMAERGAIPAGSAIKIIMSPDKRKKKPAATPKAKQEPAPKELESPYKSSVYPGEPGSQPDKLLCKKNVKINETVGGAISSSAVPGGSSGPASSITTPGSKGAAPALGASSETGPSKTIEALVPSESRVVVPDRPINMGKIIVNQNALHAKQAVSYPNGVTANLATDQILKMSKQSKLAHVPQADCTKYRADIRTPSVGIRASIRKEEKDRETARSRSGSPNYARGEKFDYMGLETQKRFEQRWMSPPKLDDEDDLTPAGKSRKDQKEKKKNRSKSRDSGKHEVGMRQDSKHEHPVHDPSKQFSNVYTNSGIEKSAAPLSAMRTLTGEGVSGVIEAARIIESGDFDPQSISSLAQNNINSPTQPKREPEKEESRATSELVQPIAVSPSNNKRVAKDIEVLVPRDSKQSLENARMRLMMAVERARSRGLANTAMQKRTEHLMNQSKLLMQESEMDKRDVDKMRADIFGSIDPNANRASPKAGGSMSKRGKMKQLTKKKSMKTIKKVRRINPEDIPDYDLLTEEEKVEVRNKIKAKLVTTQLEGTHASLDDHFEVREVQKILRRRRDYMINQLDRMVTPVQREQVNPYKDIRFDEAGLPTTIKKEEVENLVEKTRNKILTTPHVGVPLPTVQEGVREDESLSPKPHSPSKVGISNAKKEAKNKVTVLSGPSRIQNLQENASVLLIQHQWRKKHSRLNPPQTYDIFDGS